MASAYVRRSLSHNDSNIKPNVFKSPNSFFSFAPSKAQANEGSVKWRFFACFTLVPERNSGENGFIFSIRNSLSRTSRYSDSVSLLIVCESTSLISCINLLLVTVVLSFLAKDLRSSSILYLSCFLSVTLPISLLIIESIYDFEISAALSDDMSSAAGHPPLTVSSISLPRPKTDLTSPTDGSENSRQDLQALHCYYYGTFRSRSYRTISVLLYISRQKFQATIQFSCLLVSVNNQSFP